MPPTRDWVLLDSLQFVNNFFVTLKFDDPLDVTVRRMFTDVVGKLAQYSGCSHGMHLLSNVLNAAPDTPTLIEMDHIYVEAIEHEYLGESLSCRQSGKACNLSSALPEYCRKREEDTLRFKAILDRLGRGTRFVPECADQGEWKPLLDSFDEGRSGVGLTQIDCRSSHVIGIPLSDSTPTLPSGRLGTILLWNNSDDIYLPDLVARYEEKLILASKMLSVFMERLLESHYGVRGDTYLPSYRPREDRAVAIMFADIRDFTPTTERCRNFNLMAEWKSFMSEFHSDMGQIIDREGGRTQGLSGDGIMALFGEYTGDPQEGVRSAVNAAKAMYKRFRDLRATFIGQPLIAKFIANEVEPMEFDLGIGINFGRVAFDYFGAPGCRTYGPLGDHVNFAQRLESAACRFDARLFGREKQTRAPILLSRPAKVILQEELPAVSIEVKGKPYQYPAYEVWPD